LSWGILAKINEGIILMRILFVYACLLFSGPAGAIADPLQDASTFTVRIKTSIEHAFAEDEAGTIRGAGFLVDDSRGYIVTNAHVSGRGNARIEVAFKGHSYEYAEAVYVDPDLDLAILQLSPSLLPEYAVAAQLECTDRYLNGLEVAAYGHPHGLAFSASRGIISQVRTLEGEDWVQTDAAINAGNSGGALIDLETGIVVGVNAMGYNNTQGLNFAVPTPPLCSILALLNEGKNPSPPNIPVIFASDEELDEHLIVARILDETWHEAVSVGDVVSSVDNAEVYTPRELREALRGRTGASKLSLVREGEEAEVIIDVAPQEAILNRPHILMDGALISYDVYPERRKSDGLFLIHSLAAGSLSEQSELKPYHAITSVNGVAPKSLGHLYTLLNSS
jgi:serine protease Do